MTLDFHAAILYLFPGILVSLYGVLRTDQKQTHFFSG
jgi:hypothetical protein